MSALDVRGHLTGGVGSRGMTTLGSALVTEGATAVCLPGWIEWMREVEGQAVAFGRVPLGVVISIQRTSNAVGAFRRDHLMGGETVPVLTELADKCFKKYNGLMKPESCF
jgi:hypothetical protein